MSIERVPRKDIVLCTKEEFERCQTVFEEVGVDSNGNRIMAMRQGRLWKKEEGDKGESVGNKEDYD
jgi:hypothetical protein